jgi:hypothetical protein
MNSRTHLRILRRERRGAHRADRATACGAAAPRERLGQYKARATGLSRGKPAHAQARPPARRYGRDGLLGMRSPSSASPHRPRQAYPERLYRIVQRPPPRRVPQRDEFRSLAHARLIIEDWRRDYNEFRPHKSLGNHTSGGVRSRAANNPETRLIHGITQGDTSAPIDEVRQMRAREAVTARSIASAYAAVILGAIVGIVVRAAAIASILHPRHFECFKFEGTFVTVMLVLALVVPASMTFVVLVDRRLLIILGAVAAIAASFTWSYGTTVPCGPL